MEVAKRRHPRNGSVTDRERRLAVPPYDHHAAPPRQPPPQTDAACPKGGHSAPPRAGSSARVVCLVDVRHLCSSPMLRLRREGAKYSLPCSEQGARREGEVGW